MEQEAISVLVWASIIFIVILFLTALFLRWVFSVKRQLWNQKQQINLLVKIAEKLGVPNDDNMEKLSGLNNNKDDYFLD